MLANYHSQTPFLNNWGQARLYQKYFPDDDREIIKAKDIGGAEDSVSTNLIQSEHNNKIFFSLPVYDTFQSWTFSQFEEAYQGQLKIMDATITLMEKIGNPLMKSALNQTENQYRDFFFHNNFAYLVSDIYTFFQATKQVEEKHEELFRTLRERPDVSSTIRAITENQHEINEPINEEDDPHTVKGQTGPINFSFTDTVLVDINEIIKISGYTFNPLIRGTPTHIKWQEDLIYNNDSRFIVCLGSRQGGKSHVMGLRALISTFKGNRRDILVCAFEGDTTDQIKKYTMRLMENFPEGTFTEVRKKNWIVNNVTGSRIIFRSLSDEASRIRGWTLHEIIIDECFLVGDDIFESVLMPTLSTTGGTICMVSTPGPKNWFFWEVMKARQGEPEYAYYQFTLHDNPFIVPSERERILKKKDDPIIRREYFCEFDEGGNQVFRPLKIEDLNLYVNHHEESWFVLAWDPARKGKDRSAFSCFMVYTDKIIVLRSGFIPDSHKGKWELQNRWFKENILNDGHDWFLVMDATGAGDGPVEIFQSQGTKVDMAIQYTTGNAVSEDETRPFGKAEAMRVGKSYLINNAQNYMDDSIVQFYKYTNKDLFLETDAIMEKRTTSGFTGFFTKGFDDITNSCMIGLFFIEHRRLLSKRKPKATPDSFSFGDEPYFKKRPAERQHRVSGSHW